MAFMLIISVFFVDKIGKNNLEANSFVNAQITKQQVVLKTFKSIIYSNNKDLIGNVECQSYSQTITCQINATFNDLSTYKAWMKVNADNKLLFLGDLKIDKEGLYMLASSIPAEYLPSQIVITNDVAIIARANLKSL